MNSSSLHDIAYYTPYITPVIFKMQNNVLFKIFSMYVPKILSIISGLPVMTELDVNFMIVNKTRAPKEIRNTTQLDKKKPDT